MATDLADTDSLSVPASTPAPPALNAGDAIGRFLVLSKLSASATATVYLGHDPLLERGVVLKLLAPEDRGQPEAARAHCDQAKILARTNSPQIATLFDVLETPHGPVLVLEYLVGQPLDALLRSRGPLSTTDAVHLFDQALAGLERLHRANVVHAGIEPGNLFVTTDQQVKVLDFRLARNLDGRERVRGHAGSGNILYCPPEQINGSGIDFRSDLYALGACLFEAFTGALPFDKHRARADAAPQSLAGLALKAMNREPDDRFQSAHDFRLALRKFAATHADLPPLAPAGAPRPQRGRARRLWTSARFDLALLALIALLVVFLGLFPLGEKNKGGRETAAEKAAIAQPHTRPSKPQSRPQPPPPVHTPQPESDKYNALREAWGTE